MSDEDGRGAGGLEDVAHFQRQALAQFDVEVGEGLVEQQQARLGRQCPGEGDALLLAARKFVRKLVVLTGQADQLKQFGDALPAFRRG